ncbi:Uncharacterized surface anchored protein [Lachnospiraceae bacterium G11]|nr:Uncharacterized surface anchored protein [Lachnospiraceae bacterium G11]
MGRRILAMLICVALILGVYHSPSINVHASNDINEDEADIDLPLEDEELWEEIEAEPTAVPSATPTEIVEEPVELVSEETEAAEEVSDEEVSEEEALEGEVSEEEVLPEEEVKEEVTAPAPLSENKQIGDLNICIDAPEGVFPAGTYAVVTEITSAGVISSIEDAVASQLSDSQTITNIRAFDITMYDAAGNEVQPDTDKGVVNVSIKNINTIEAITNPDKDMEVFHVEDSFNGVNAVDTTVLAGEVCFEAEHFSPYAVVSIEDNQKDPVNNVIEPQALIKAITLGIVNKDNTVTPLSSSGINKIALGDKIRVTYEFNEPMVINAVRDSYGMGDGYHVMKGENYALPDLPEELRTSSGYSIDVKSKKMLGQIIIDANGKSELKIDDTFIDQEKATNISAFVDLSLNLSKEVNGDKDSYELTLGGQKYNIKVADFMPQPPKVTKEASSYDEATGEVTWTVTVKNDAKPIEYKDGLSFKDTFSKGQSYVKDSLKVVGGSSITPDSASDSSISWKYKDNTANKETKFEYKTLVDFHELTYKKNTSGSTPTQISNNISVNAPATDDYEKLSLTAKAEKTVSKTMKNWVTKSGTKVDGNGKAIWTITIHNNGFRLQNVVLHDTILADTDITIDESTIKVIDNISKADVEFEHKIVGDEHQLIFKNDMAGDAEYIVTYETTIENYATYLKKNHKIPENKAWLEYDYDATGNGPAKSFKGPDIGEKFQGDDVYAKAAIEKSPKGINRVNHTMDWEVKINNTKRELTDVKVTDVLPEGHVYESVSSVTIGNSGATEGVDYTIDVAASGKEFTIDFGDNVKGFSASFRVTTKLTPEESKIWASNQTESYTNTATIYSKESGLDNEPVTDTATQKYDTVVLEKAAGAYNYDTHEIHYTITVNKYGMPLTGVLVTDELIPELEYVTDSYKRNGTPDSGVTVNGNKLVFNLGDINEKTMVEFDARVRDGAVFANNRDDIEITNEASVKSNEYTTDTSVNCSTKFNNKVIKKRGEIRPGSPELVDYTVDLNVAKQNLYNGAIGEVVIEDTIGASLSLQDGTVKLYKANVDPTDGSLTYVGEPVDTTIRIDRSKSRTVLQVVIPNDGGGNAYVLKYIAKAVNDKADDFSNNVVLKGYGDSSLNSSKKDYTKAAFSSVDFDQYVYCISELRDKNGNNLIKSGAHFELLDPAIAGDNKVVDEADSNADGVIIFVGNGDLKENYTYLLRETDAPEGYEIPIELQTGMEVTTPDKKGYNAAKNHKSENQVYNSKPSREITFELLSGKDKTTDLTKMGDDPKPVKISVLKDGVEVWNSDSSTPFRAIYGTEYEVKESKTPFGYKGESVTGYKFMIDETDPAHELKITSGSSETGVVTGDKITMYDSPYESLAIKVNDISAAQGMYLKGAKFTLKKGGTVVKEWVSDGDFKTIEIPEGDGYELERVTEPTGFAKTTKVLKFNVEKDALSGELKVVVPTKATPTLEVDGDKIIVSEESDDSAKKALDDTEKAKLSLPAEISELALTPFVFKDGVPSSVADTPEWTGTDASTMKLSPQVQYLLTVTDKSGKKVTKIAMINEKGELVVSDYIPPKKAAPAPAKSSSSGDSSSSSDDDDKNAKKKEAPKEENKLVEEKKTVTTVKTKPRFGKVNKDRFRLAKTGGFMGTMAGYGAGYGLIIAGALMVICNKKKRK